MGAYLATPLTDKESTDEGNEYLACGASQMQGWRMSQEDAHICSLDFDKSTSLFAVFDGHGGSEVALYCSKKLPGFLKNTDAYKRHEYEQALKDAFIGFDATLIDEEIIEELKKLMPADKLDGETESDEDGDDYEEDLSKLRQESRMPLNELLEKLKEAKNIPLAELRGEGSGAKPLSPFLRGRRNGPASGDSTKNGECSLPEAGGSARRQLDVNAAKEDEEETVSSSSALAANDKGPSSNEPSSSSISTGSGDASPIAGSASEANVDNCGPSSSSGNGGGAGSSTKADFANSPDSSSAANKRGDNNATAASSGSNTVSAKHETHAVADEGGSSSSSSAAKTAVDDSGKGESVSSSSTAANGVVASSEPSHTEKSQNKISSSGSNLPLLNDSDDSSTSDGSYKEGAEGDVDGKSDTEEDADSDEEADEEIDAEEDEEDDDDDDSDDGMGAADHGDDEMFLNNMFEGPGSSSGCTAVVALLAGNELYVANAGDSRCVVCRNGTAMDMSADHKPEDAEELERIQKAGGRVTFDGRVNGGLNLSRAIGDHAYKTNKDLKAEEQMISAMPDVRRVTLSPDDEFMILACDGIWNSLNSEEVVQFVRSRILKGETKMSTICEELFSKCLAPDTHGDGTGCDNMTAVIVQFKPLLLSQAPVNNESEKMAADVTTTTSATTKKRSASPTAPDNEPNADSHKRIKTDDQADVTSIVETAEPASA